MAIYTGLEARLHEAFWGERGGDLELGSLQELLHTQNAELARGRGLEIGSGSGRLLYSLAKLGFEMEGLEPSIEMRELSDQRGGDAPLVVSEQRWEDFVPNEPYDALFFTSFVLQILPDPLAALQKAAHHLSPGGLLYLSIFIPWAEIVGELIEGEWLLDDEIRLNKAQKARCWVNFQIDRVGQRLERSHRYELFRGKKCIETTETKQALQWFCLPEMRMLLAHAGLETQQEHYDFKETYDSDAHVLSLLARKV